MSQLLYYIIIFLTEFYIDLIANILIPLTYCTSGDQWGLLSTPDIKVSREPLINSSTKQSSMYCTCQQYVRYLHFYMQYVHFLIHVADVTVIS